MINSDVYDTSRTESWRSTAEVNLPFNWLAEQTLTLGMEWNRDELNDPASMQATTTTDALPGCPAILHNAAPRTAPR